MQGAVDIGSEALRLTLKTQSPTSLSKDYLHPDDHAKQITDTPGYHISGFAAYDSVAATSPM